MYAKHAWAVFPVYSAKDGRCSCGSPNCRDVGKHPRTHHGHKDATIDIKQIEQWWGEDPDANVGIATGPSGLLVLDVDVGEGKDGFQSLIELEQEFGPLPETFTTRTGGGGQHQFFRAPVGRIRNRTGLRPGVDIRADAGYIIVPPSLHRSGRRYEWEVDHRPDVTPLAPMPAWLLDKITIRDGTSLKLSTSGWQTLVENGVSEGQRNATIARLSGHLLRRFVDPHVALVLLQSWNRTHLKPPLPDDEVTRTVNSVAGIELARRAHANG